MVKRESYKMKCPECGDKFIGNKEFSVHFNHGHQSSKKVSLEY